MPKSKPRARHAARRSAFALSQANVEVLHDVIVAELWPGDEPIAAGEYRDTQLLGSATGRPFQTAFGQDLYQTMLEKAAALFHSLIANHPFYNGNKRAAVLALDHFLLANGYALILSDVEVYRLAKDTATYRERGISHEAIFRQIADTLTRAAIPLRHLKNQPGLADLYRTSLKLRRVIRRHRLNRPQPRSE